MVLQSRTAVPPEAALVYIVTLKDSGQTGILGGGIQSAREGLIFATEQETLYEHTWS